MKKCIELMLVVVMAITLVGCSQSPTPEPERCGLCDYIPSHAPCLVNLSTGEVGEIFCYDPHPVKVGEIADYQRGGYFCFMSVAGLRGYLDACVPEAHIYVPFDTEKYEEKFFCNNCRKQLSDFADDGYVLVDLREPETPLLYPVVAGEEFSVRCYNVSITEREDKDELDITVVGTIKPSNDGGEVITEGQE